MREWFPRLHARWTRWRFPPGPEDVFLALRGLRTMDFRLREAERQGSRSRSGCKTRPEVQRVIHPALPDDPGYEIWKRDFLGSSGLFSMVSEAGVEPRRSPRCSTGWNCSVSAIRGAATRALIIPFDCANYRTATHWAPGGPTMRFSVGLEDIEDLKEDLARGFDRLRAASWPDG